MHHAHLCWMSSVDPFFSSFISAMNLLTANSVLGAFSERRLTNVIFSPIGEMQPVQQRTGNGLESVSRGQFWAKFAVFAERYEIWYSKGYNSWKFFQSATVGFQLFVVAAGLYKRLTNVRVVSSGKGSDIRSGETSVMEKLADDNRTRTVTDVLSYQVCTTHRYRNTLLSDNSIYWIN